MVPLQQYKSISNKQNHTEWLSSYWTSWQTDGEFAIYQEEKRKKEEEKKKEKQNKSDQTCAPPDLLETPQFSLLIPSGPSPGIPQTTKSSTIWSWWFTLIFFFAFRSVREIKGQLLFLRWEMVASDP